MHKCSLPTAQGNPHIAKGSDLYAKSWQKARALLRLSQTLITHSMHYVTVMSQLLKSIHFHTNWISIKQKRLSFVSCSLVKDIQRGFTLKAGGGSGGGEGVEKGVVSAF